MNLQEQATARAMLVLTRETRRAKEAAERVDLVVQALGLRYGVPVGESPRGGHSELVYTTEEFD